jgi:hypothetical protein
MANPQINDEFLPNFVVYTSIELRLLRKLVARQLINSQIDKNIKGTRHIGLFIEAIGYELFDELYIYLTDRQQVICQDMLLTFLYLKDCPLYSTSNNLIGVDIT